jgi:hypothetical protein
MNTMTACIRESIELKILYKTEEERRALKIERDV